MTGAIVSDGVESSYEFHPADLPAEPGTPGRAVSFSGDEAEPCFGKGNRPVSLDGQSIKRNAIRGAFSMRGARFHRAAL